MSAPSQQLRVGAALGMMGNLIPGWVVDAQKDFYTFPITFVLAATAGITATQPFTIDNNCAFFLTTLTGRVYETATPATLVADPALLVTITDTSSGRNFQSATWPWSSLIGTGALPGMLPYPKLLPPNSSVAVTVTNQVATAYTARLVCSGFKIFDWPTGAMR